MNNGKMIAPSFCYILAANFLLFFAFYLILPILSFYLKERFVIGESMIRFILSCYTLATLCIRPLVGYLLDTFTRRSLYLMTYFIFTTILGGYVIATALIPLITLRAIRGFTFGMIAVARNTVLVDILPSSRRGEGIGYYGLASGITISFGPMIGLFMQENFTYDMIFSCPLLSGSLDFIMTYTVKTPYKQSVRRGPIPLDRFFLVEGTWVGISLLLLSVPYGMTTAYVTIYTAGIGIGINSGLYSIFMAVRLVVSRLFSERQVGRGRITLVTSLEMYLAATISFLLAALKELMHWNPVFSSYFYIGIAPSQGMAFGTMFLTFNVLFVSLAPNNQRDIATSTYLTSWNVGIDIGLTAGSSIAQELGGFSYACLSGTCLTVLSTFSFLFKAGPHFNRHGLR